MKRLLLLLGLVAASVQAQQLTYPLPLDARNTVLYFGVGNSYGFQLVPTTSAYSTLVRYEIPKTGLDQNRAYRHISVINPSDSRTLYVCFGGASGCSVDNIIIPPGYSLVYEPLRFGDSVGFPYIYTRLDSAGSVTATFAVW